MTSDEIRARVHAILAEQAMIDPSDIADEARLADLGIDSMGLVEAIFVLEEAFDVQVPYNANAPGAGGFDVTTVAAVVDGIRDLVARRGP